jgi:hypothetical protein
VEKPKDNNSKTSADAHPERLAEIFLLFLKILACVFEKTANRSASKKNSFCF